MGSASDELPYYVMALSDYIIYGVSVNFGTVLLYSRDRISKGRCR